MSSRFRFAAMFPMKGARRFRLVGVVPEPYRQLESPTFDELQPHFRETMGELMRFSDVAWFATYRVHHRVAERFKKGNVFLAGDAAHVHSPVGGQGMNTGLQDAYNLAWKLALVLRGEADERLLETYHVERHPNAVKLVNTTDAIFSGFIPSTRGWAGFVRRRVLPLVVSTVLPLKPVQARLFHTLSQTALTYRGRGVSVGHLRGKVGAGDRFPWFTADGRDVHTYLSPARFTLFALGSGAHEAGLEEFRSGLLEVVGLPDCAGYKRVGLSDGFYVVRPDGYIGTASRRADDVRAYLTQTLGLYSDLKAGRRTASSGLPQLNGRPGSRVRR